MLKLFIIRDLLIYGHKRISCILIKNKPVVLNNNKIRNTFPLIKHSMKTFSHLQITATDTVWEKHSAKACPRLCAPLLSHCYSSHGKLEPIGIAQQQSIILYMLINTTGFSSQNKASEYERERKKKAKPEFVKLLLFLCERYVTIRPQPLYMTGWNRASVCRVCAC